MSARAGGAEQEPRTSELRALRPEWSSIVEAVETIRGRAGSEAANLHGLWIRDAVRYTAVRRLGYRLMEGKGNGVRYRRTTFTIGSPSAIAVMISFPGLEARILICGFVR